MHDPGDLKVDDSRIKLLLGGSMAHRGIEYNAEHSKLFKGVLLV